MPIGSGIVYNTGDLILSQVSSSGRAFLETKIAAATSSIIYFDSTARVNSASLNSITVGTASYFSGSTAIIGNLTASNISASGTGSFGIVGIGTNSPAYKLDVNGNANFTNGFYTNTDASSTSYFVGANGTRPIIFQNNTGASYDFGFKFFDSNTFTIVGGNTLANPTTDLVSFTYDGKVGIGTTSPSALLHVYTGSIGGTAYPLLIDNSSGGAGVNVVGFGFANGGIMKHSITTAIYGNDYMAFNVGQGASYNQERMRIDSTGNVGIGTTTVSRKLHAYVATGPVMRLQSSGSNASIEFIPSIGHGRYNWLIGAQQNISDAFEITPSTATNGTTFSNPSLLITSAGNVGVGTTSPRGGLHVNTINGSDANEYAGLVVSATVSSSRGVNIAYDATNDVGTITAVNNGVAWKDLTLQPVGGLVGIRTKTPLTLLDVRGGYITSGDKVSVQASKILAGYYNDGALVTLGGEYSNGGPVLGYAVWPSGSAGTFISSTGINISRGAYTIRGSTHIWYSSTGSSTVVINSAVALNSVASLDSSGSFVVNSVTSSLYGTSSWANNVVSASYATTAQTANALNTGNSYTIAGLTNNGTLSQQGTLSMGSGYQILSTTGTVTSPGIAYVGNTNTGFYSPSTNTIGFVTSGSERMRIESGGNISIGTSAADMFARGYGKVLGISGSNAAIELNSNSGQNSYLDLGVAATRIGGILASSTTLEIGTPGAIPLHLYTSGSYKLTVQSDGNVGIGTTTVNSKLQVYTGAVSNNTFAFTFGDASRGLNYIPSTAGGSYNFASIGGSALFNSIGSTFWVGVHDGAAIRFDDKNISVWNGSTTVNMYISSSGDVGIGTTAPTVQSNYRFLQVNGTNAAIIETMVGGTRIGGFDSHASNLYVGSIGSYPIVFRTAVNEKMRITAAGLVGIGTSSPGAKLEVQSGSILIRGDGNALFGTYYASAGENTFFTIHSGSGNTFHIGNDVAGTYYNTMVFTAAADATGGNVGIGTSSPINKLQVNGNISGSSFTSSISNAVGFLGTSSWAQNVVSSSFATTAQTANALNTGNAYTIAGLTNNGTLSQQGTLSMGSSYQILAITGTVSSPGIAFVGDTNNGFYAPSADTIGFVTNGSEKVRIDSSGNVGIGTTVPSSSLTVQSNGTQLRLQTTSGPGAYFSEISARYDSTHPFGIYVANNSSTTTEYMGVYADSGGSNNRVAFPTGNVGVGSTSPTSKFEVLTSAVSLANQPNIIGNFRGDTDGRSLIRVENINSNIGAAAQAGISFLLYSNISNQPSSSRHEAQIILGSTGGTSVGQAGTLQIIAPLDIAFNVSSSNTIMTGSSYGVYGSNAMYISRTGNIGIGTTSPGALLEISSSTASSLLNVKGVGGNGILYVSSSGNVGIGTTSPASKLSIAGSSASNFKSLILRNGDGTVGSTVSIDLETSAGTIGDEAAMAARISGIRLGSGTTGGLIFSTTNNGILGERVRILNDGNVGIGTTSPIARLTVTPSGSAFDSTNAMTAYFGKLTANGYGSTFIRIARSDSTTSTGSNAEYTDIEYNSGGAGPFRYGTFSDTNIINGNSATGGAYGNINFITSGSVRMIIGGGTNAGNIGIGTTNPTDKLTVYGALASYKTGADTIQTQVYLANSGNTRAFNLQLNSGGTGLDLWSFNSSNAWLKHTTFDYDGRVGIGTAAPVAKFEISGSSNSALMNIKSPISGAILYVSGSGAVGIGTSNVGTYTLQVNGSFGATTKSFIIDHPTKEGKKLIYGSLESPYHGIRLTGRDTLVNGKCKIQLPDYIYKLILHDSVNIQLTGIKCNKTLYVDDINIPENYFTIAYDKAIFETYKDYDFFWDFTAIRADVPELITEL